MKNSILILLIFCQLSIAQKKTINKFDDKLQRHGRWEFYSDDANTKITSKGKFKHGDPIKIWLYYRADGSLEKKEKTTFFKKKIKTTFYHPNGKVYRKGKAKMVDEPDGVHYYWYGKWKYYDDNGKPTKIETYIMGKLIEEAELK